MNKAILFLFMLMFTQSCWLGPKLHIPDAVPGQQAPVHDAWDALLKKRVDEDGWVDYRGFEADRAALQGYLDHLAGYIPGDHWSKEEQLAYYINLYNAGTVLLILDHYPLESIKDIWNPWGKNRLTIGSSAYSLNDIEHRILRKMEEPRIHFAVNCASKGCPPLFHEPFEGRTLEDQLNDAPRRFINDPDRYRLDAQTLYPSKIFDWYGEDLNDNPVTYFLYYAQGDPKTHLAQQRSRLKVDYLDYDWSLNGR